MIDFPNSPTLNQIYTFNGLTWQWNGSAWISIGASSTSGITNYVSTFNGLTGDVTGTSIPRNWFFG
jgi:hypothetical protein